MTVSSSPPVDTEESTLSKPMAATTTTTAEDVAGSTTIRASRAMTNRLGQERQIGDSLPFDQFVIGGTLSLACLLLIGGIVVLAVSLVDQSTFKDASLNDFVPLGEEGCQILNTSSYRFFDEEINALNSRCVEEYRYNVQVVSETSSDEEIFVSNVLRSIVCTGLCDFCNDNEFRGPTYYTGVVVNQEGEAISSDTLVECWAPRTDSLSVFYTCPTNSEAVPCYLLQDPSLPLKDAMDSNQLGMIAAWVGLVGSVIFFTLVVWFVRRNRQVLKRDAELLAAAQDGGKEPEVVGGKEDTLRMAPTSDDLA
jgi:hypothetical protein